MRTEHNSPLLLKFLLEKFFNKSINMVNHTIMKRFAGFVPVAYSSCYGSGTFFNKFFNEELERRVNSFAAANSTSFESVPNFERQWITADILEEFGSEKCSGKTSKMSIVYISKRFEDFYGKHEYDGIETVYIDTEAYKMAEIKSITYDEGTAFEKRIERLKFLLEEKLDEKVYTEEDVIKLLAAEEKTTHPDEI